MCSLSPLVERALQRHPWTPEVPLYPDENTEVALLTEFLFPAGEGTGTGAAGGRVYDWGSFVGFSRKFGVCEVL